MVHVETGSNVIIGLQCVTKNSCVIQTEHCKLCFLPRTIKIGKQDVYSYCVTRGRLSAAGDQTLATAREIQGSTEVEEVDCVKTEHCEISGRSRSLPHSVYRPTTASNSLGSFCRRQRSPPDVHCWLCCHWWSTSTASSYCSSGISLCIS